MFGSLKVSYLKYHIWCSAVVFVLFCFVCLFVVVGFFCFFVFFALLHGGSVCLASLLKINFRMVQGRVVI